MLCNPPRWSTAPPSLPCAYAAQDSLPWRPRPSEHAAFNPRAAVALLTVLVRGALATAPQWGQRGHDAMHSGRSPYFGSAASALKWSFTTSSGVLSSPAISADGTVYVGSTDDNVYRNRYVFSEALSIGRPTDTYPKSDRQVLTLTQGRTGVGGPRIISSTVPHRWDPLPH